MVKTYYKDGITVIYDHYADPPEIRIIEIASGADILDLSTTEEEQVKKTLYAYEEKTI